MTENVMKTEGHTPTPWYVGSQNDMLYIVDKPPRPAPADYPYDIPDLTVVSKMMGPDFSTERDNANFIVTAVNERSALLRCEEALREARTCLNQALGVIVEFGNLNGFRNLSDAELGRAVIGMAERGAAMVSTCEAALTLLDEARK